MAKSKKTQLELLQEIVDLLTPVSNLSRYQIQKINEQIAKEQSPLKQTKTAESEMKKEAEKESK